MSKQEPKVGDTVRGTIKSKAPHPNDPHPHNPSRFVTKKHTFEGEVLEVKEGGVMIDSGRKGKMRLKTDEIDEVVERGDGREPISFEAAGEDWKAVWSPSDERYEVKKSGQFDVWATPDGDVKSRLDVYKNVDPRVREDVREKMGTVAAAFKEALK